MSHSKVGALALALVVWAFARGDSVAIAQAGDPVNINLIVNEKTITAKMIDSPTARDFIALLPLTLTMNDLFKREKYAELPRPISGN
jgi:hypothetical protein